MLAIAFTSFAQGRPTQEDALAAKNALAKRQEQAVRERKLAIRQLQELQVVNATEKKFIDAMKESIERKQILEMAEYVVRLDVLALQLARELQQSIQTTMNRNKRISKWTCGLVSPDSSICNYKSACESVKESELRVKECKEMRKRASLNYKDAKLNFEQMKDKYPALAKKYAELERRLHL